MSLERRGEKLFNITAVTLMDTQIICSSFTFDCWYFLHVWKIWANTSSKKRFFPQNEERKLFSISFTTCRVEESVDAGRSTSWDHFLATGNFSISQKSEKMKLNELIFALLIGAVCVVRGQNYCDRSLCNGNSHVGCLHSGVRLKFQWFFSDQYWIIQIVICKFVPGGSSLSSTV